MPSKDNFYSTENIDELAMSIELVGHIEQNLVVKPEAHGKYEVVAGHRRRLAALKLVQEGKEEYRKVPCLIKKESDTIKMCIRDRATLRLVLLFRLSLLHLILEFIPIPLIVSLINPAVIVFPITPYLLKY